jgi:hypothetical protein
MGKQIVAAAPGGNRIDYNEFVGKLFVVEPLEVEHGIQTSVNKDPVDAVRANVYVLLGKDRQEEFEDTLIFPRVLQGQVRRKIGSLVVGRLGQGEGKKGQNPPWILAEPSASDLKKATDFWSARSMSAASSDDDYDEPESDNDDGDSF